MNTISPRIQSIDIIRALIMLLMIFVNDLWTLIDIPSWLEHAGARDDRMGLADVVFPAFLFIVGLSIPFAVNNRRKKGEKDMLIAFHILKRSLALIVMGFFMVNLENVNRDLLPVSKYVWQILMALSFILIWNDYKDKKFYGIPVWILQVAGILVLIVLAFLYKGGTIENPGWMKPRWWGILGLIGWAYLLGALVYLYLGRSWIWIVIGLLLLHLLNLQEFHLIKGFPVFQIVVGASNHVLVMSGIFISWLYMSFRAANKSHTMFILVLLIFALVMIAYGCWVRPFGGISKILATPSWTSICAGITTALFALFYIVADLLNINKWAMVIRPAGTSTLTCYLVPYFYYAFLGMIGIYLPEFLRTGIIGIIKSLLFGFLIILITGLLEKINIKLRI